MLRKRELGPLSVVAAGGCDQQLQKLDRWPVLGRKARRGTWRNAQVAHPGLAGARFWSDSAQISPYLGDLPVRKVRSWKRQGEKFAAPRIWVFEYSAASATERAPRVADSCQPRRRSPQPA